MTSPGTETRGAWLWRKMANVYGAQFLDMWEGVDAADMQDTWTEALRAANVTREGLMRGVSKLWHVRRPPTLPEFIELCAPPSAMYRQRALALIDERRTSPEEARAQLAKVRALAEQVLVDSRGTSAAGIRWANRLLERAAAGEYVTPGQVEHAKQAIEQWRMTHGRHDNGHEREPGCDDEVIG
ncbi:hypothetical protein [Paraburkholderia unamae]|uniref:Uncharacterized protein n=1 Tax=Paraburkholderia unamae TaxID=219649 RepID=A0ACC6RPX9_9BURK